MYGICKQFQRGCVKSFSLSPGLDTGADADLIFSDQAFIKFDDEIDAADFRDFLSDYFDEDFFVVEVA